MKRLPLAGLVLLMACSQPATQKVASTTIQAPQSVEAKASTAVVSTVDEASAAALAVFDTTQLERYSPERMMGVLAAHDLSVLFRYDSLQNPIQNGFFGPNHYRIEMLFTSVRQDSTQPNVFHITGKSRHKKVITPFTGTLNLTKMWHQKSTGDILPAQMPYEVQGTFDLREDAGSKYAGRFTGQSKLYFALDESGDLDWGYQLGYERAGTAGLFQGMWQPYAHQAAQPVMWAQNIELIAEKVLPNFNIGERETVVNPKYAKLGWNNYWENDEWWAATPTPALSL
jgi:hypothetical protein